MMSRLKNIHLASGRDQQMPVYKKIKRPPRTSKVLDGIPKKLKKVVVINILGVLCLYFFKVNENIFFFLALNLIPFFM